jgi:hypothetical protein
VIDLIGGQSPAKGRHIPSAIQNRAPRLPRTWLRASREIPIK